MVGVLSAGFILLAGCAGGSPSQRENRAGDRDSIDRLENELKKAQELVRALRAQLAAAAVEREALLADVAEFKADARMRRQEVDQVGAEKALLEDRLRLSDQAERELWKKHQQAAALLGFLADEAAALRSDWRDFELKLRMRLRPGEDRETIDRLSRLADRIDRLRFELLREWSSFGEKPGSLASTPAPGQGAVPVQPPPREPPPAVVANPAAGGEGIPTAGGNPVAGAAPGVEAPGPKAGGDAAAIPPEPPRPLPAAVKEPAPAVGISASASDSHPAAAVSWLEMKGLKELIRILILVSSGAFSAAVFLFGLRKLRSRRLAGAGAGAATGSHRAQAVQEEEAPAEEAGSAWESDAGEVPEDYSAEDSPADGETGEVSEPEAYRGTELVQEAPEERPAPINEPPAKPAPPRGAVFRKIPARRQPSEGKKITEDGSAAAEPPSSTQVISQPFLEDGSHTQVISEEFLPRVQKPDAIKKPASAAGSPTQRIRAPREQQKTPGGNTGAPPARTQEIEGPAPRPGGGKSGTSQFRTQEIENAASHRPGGSAGTGQMRTQEIDDAALGHSDPRRPAPHRHVKPPPDDSALLAELEQIIKHKLDEPTR